ncbi:hypothetical protein K523DRAFT_336705 [Schizophyllum commune Tattone D]|nr:hypothetical protein K523DRAFT_336705 [Schizophyllum commune Tattone D]
MPRKGKSADPARVTVHVPPLTAHSRVLEKRRTQAAAPRYPSAGAPSIVPPQSSQGKPEPRRRQRPCLAIGGDTLGTANTLMTATTSAGRWNEREFEATNGNRASAERE